MIGQRAGSMKDQTRRARSALDTSAFILPPSSFAVIIALCAMMAACGFQLRGQAAIPFQTVRVETPEFSAFADDLERAIRSGNKVRIVNTRDEAEAVIQIVGESQEKHILSLSSGGKVREFELRYRVAYRLTNRAGVDLALPGEIVLRRDMTYDDTLVLAKESEELLLFRDMRTDAVRQILRRLSVAKPAT
ncbi:MAG TPA: LPS assembly lipoprotein LptE [Burkholderiales bacterium]|nr:LPS assembly lipoprotein LptE [Burkholderiales bacterium]